MSETLKVNEDTMPTVILSEKFSTRLRESLKEASKGFGMCFALGFAAIEIGFPLAASIAKVSLTPESLTFAESSIRVAANMLSIYTEGLKPPSLDLHAASVMVGTLYGLNGAITTGGLRFNRSR